MAAADEAPNAAPDDRLARRNAVVLAFAQALSGGNNAVIISTGGIVGTMLAPDRGLATLSISMMVVGTWLGTLPIGWLSANFGRRTALQVGSGAGMLAGLLSCIAVLQGSFALFCLGAFSAGFYAAAHQSYRFAAADTASDAFRPKAISWVLAGGVFASLIGPQLIIATKDIWPPHLFAATFLGQAGLAALAALVLTQLRIPRPPAKKARAGGRPLMQIAASPRFVTAVVCGVVAYSMMNLVMTSAPLAMIDCGHSVTDATLGIQWHMLGMFAPSFFTGSLIQRFGVNRVVLAGLVLIGISAVIGIAGLTLAHFWIALVLLGVGWNFALIGATAMVTECHRPEERNKVQAFNDFLIFGSMAIGSLASGKLMATLGWVWVNQVVFPPVAVATLLVVWLALKQRRPAV